MSLDSGCQPASPVHDYPNGAPDIVGPAAKSFEGMMSVRVVLVEDDELVGGALAIALQDAGYDVFVETGEAAAMARVAETAADLVITDLRLGAGDGVGLIGDLRTRYPDIAVIAISGGGSNRASLDRARAAGADYCLQKPFSGKVLLQTIAEVMGDVP